MKLICRLLGRSRRGMILPTALVLTTLLFSLLAMTVSQGANRVQAGTNSSPIRSLTAAF